MVEKKIKGWCIEVGENLIDLYDKGYTCSSSLQFPYKRKKYKGKKVKRVSEQEARFAFAHVLSNKEGYYYAIEVPTKNRYSDFSSEPKVYIGDKEGGRSGNIDMSILEPSALLEAFKQKEMKEEEPIVTIANIEFKKGQPKDSSIKKDLLKLLFEESKIGVFYHVLEHTRRNTINSFLKKFNKSLKEVRQSTPCQSSNLILLFIVVLENEKQKSRSISIFFDPNSHQLIEFKHGSLNYVKY